jgi:hypothetical protein
VHGFGLKVELMVDLGVPEDEEWVEICGVVVKKIFCCFCG